MQLFDYHLAYCRMTVGEHVPSERKGKYVIITQSDTPCLILGAPKLHPYHAHIVAAYCERNDVDYRWDPANGRNIPDPKEVLVLGGGRYVISDGPKTLRLYDYSTAYGPPPPEALDLNEIDGYTVSRG